MFGHESLPSKNYEYGCKPPVTNCEMAIEQLFLTNRFRNALVDNELNRRKHIQETRERLFPGLVSLQDQKLKIEEEIKELCDQQKLLNQTNRKKSVDPKLAGQIKAKKLKLVALKLNIKAKKDILSSSKALKKAWKFVNEEFQEKAKAIEHDFSKQGLFWGTSGMSRLTIKKKGDAPRFKRFTGEGRVGMQIQKGLSIEGAFGCRDQRLRIKRLEDFELRNSDGKVLYTARTYYVCLYKFWTLYPNLELAESGCTISSVISKDKCLVSIRINSDSKSKPIWADLPMIYHRPIPEDCLIKWIWIERKKVGTHWKWKVNFSVSKQTWERADKTGSGYIGIDVNWRRLDTGVRVAYGVGNDGRRWELVIPNERIERFQKVEDLISIRDKNFNAAKHSFGVWLKNSKGIPEWLKEKTKNVALWRSTAKLASVVFAWRKDRFAGDEGAYEALEKWRQQDKHLYDWQAFQTRNNILWRKDTFRKFVCKLRRHYEYVKIENLNVAEMRKNAAPEEVCNVSKTNRNIASIGLLLAIIKETVRYQTVNPRNTSKTCHCCDKLTKLDGKDLTYTCEHCGQMWDRDYNSAINIRESESIIDENVFDESDIPSALTAWG